jgi:hypothetical protein
VYRTLGEWDRRKRRRKQTKQPQHKKTKPHQMAWEKSRKVECPEMGKNVVKQRGDMVNGKTE